MKKSLFLLAFLLVTPAAVAEEVTPLAHVIDSNTERIPSQTIVPKYPHKARRDRIEGEVEVCFEIDRKGRPRRIAVRNSTNRAFEKPSTKAVRASSFRPLEEGEDLQSIKSCRTFIFSLEPVEKEIESPNESNAPQTGSVTEG